MPVKLVVSFQLADLKILHFWMFDIFPGYSLSVRYKFRMNFAQCITSLKILSDVPRVKNSDVLTLA